MKRILLTAILVIAFASVGMADSLSSRTTSGSELGYFYEATIADGVTGNTVPIPPLKVGSKRITVTIIAGANTGSIEFSTSSDALVASGGATWQTWPKGIVTGTHSDSLVGQVTALRAVSAAGEIKYEILY